MHIHKKLYYKIYATEQIMSLYRIKFTQKKDHPTRYETRVFLTILICIKTPSLQKFGWQLG